MKNGAIYPPYFVFGALRSGTTMFRLMLNNHPGISNPGEADFLFDYLNISNTHPSGWRYDKEEMSKSRIFQACHLEMPDPLDGLDLLVAFLDQLRARVDGVLILNVHRHAAKIAAVLPDARFIHLIRDGRDVACSSIGMGWTGNSYYGVDHWVRTEHGWNDAVAKIPPAQVLTLKFEMLMANTKAELTRVCAFMDVPFSAIMLEYHKNSSYGPPNPSIAQQWQTKVGPHAIALIEGKSGALLMARDYTLNGAPHVPNLVEHGYLFCENRVFRWQFNLRRLGVGLFVKSYLAKVAGSRKMRDQVRMQRHDKITKMLK